MKIAKITYPRVKPDLYVITDQGTVINTVLMRPMSYEVDKDGYFRVTLTCDDGKSRHFSVARLVAWQFCDHTDPDRNQVNHMNGEKKYNFASNLEWVTSAENTRHAVCNHLRDIRGDHNGNSKYSEEFVRSVCERYQNGDMPIDIYNDYYPNEPIRYQSQHNFYAFLYRLKRREAWPHVVKDYVYDTQTSRHDPSVKKFMPRPDSRYNEDDVRWICEKLEDGFSVSEIVQSLLNGARENFIDYDATRLRDIVGSIRRGNMWVNISREYDFSSETERISLDEYSTIFKDLIDKGFNHNQIIEIVSMKYHKSRRHIGRILSNFESFVNVDGTPVNVTI